MIENMSDLLSAIVIVAIPFVMFILFIRVSVSSLGRKGENETEKQIEYYKEW